MFGPKIAQPPNPTPVLRPQQNMTGTHMRSFKAMSQRKHFSGVKTEWLRETNGWHKPKSYMDAEV